MGEVCGQPSLNLGLGKAGGLSASSSSTPFSHTGHDRRRRLDSESKTMTDNSNIPATTRQDRKNCWDSRDAYFACLDSVGVLYAGKEGDACTAENTAYHQHCAKSWVRKLDVQVSQLTLTQR